MKLVKRFRYMRHFHWLAAYSILQLVIVDMHLGHSFKLLTEVMVQFVFGVRSQSVLIDLLQTMVILRRARGTFGKLAFSRVRLFFTSTLRFPRHVISYFAILTGEPVYWGRWIGGIITNFRAMRRAWVRHLWLKFVFRLSNRRFRLLKLLSPFFWLKIYPAIVLVDGIATRAPVHEVLRMAIPSSGMTDSNEWKVRHVVPIYGNDDSMSALGWLVSWVARMLFFSKTLDGT